MKIIYFVKVLIFLSFLSFSCGKKETHIYNRDLTLDERAQGEQESRTEVNLSQDLSLLAPKKRNFKANLFVAKGAVLPDTDSRFFKVRISNTGIKNLNGFEFKNGTRKVEIYGKNILLDDQDTQGIKLLIKDARGISDVLISAETVNISTPVNIPGANLTINAKSLIFSSTGRVDLTPLKNNELPKTGKDGADGQHAGILNLNIHEISHSSTGQPLFILNGGDGQAAGLGARGENGVSRTEIAPGGVVYMPFYNYEGACMNFSDSTCRIRLIPSQTRGIQAWPTNGGDATAGGKPGLPGNGGTVISTIDINESLFQLKRRTLWRART